MFQTAQFILPILAGAFGFTTTSAPQHLGYKGRPLACRLASHDELRSYSRVLKDLGRGAIEIALTSQASKVNAEERITSEPADFFGIKKRGRFAPGMAADFALFDLATVGSDVTGTMRRDLPGGGRRLVMAARGVEYTIVNGKILFEHDVDSGARAGQVLHSANA